MPDRSIYTIQHILHQGFQTIIYRVQVPAIPNPVILKLLKLENPTPETIDRLKREYQIHKQLNDFSIVKAYSLDTFDGRLGMLIEDFGGVSLKQILSHQKMSIASFLNVALQLIKALVAVHACQIVHKDIKPTNIIINPTSGIVKLTDFSIAVDLKQENQVPIDPDEIQGTLAYISPEQTGRIDRPLDCRSDFYSLGITFYEMLAGQLPFLSNDPLELVHCHLAKQPIALRELNPEVPPEIALIIEKLLAKNADDRYENATEILVDLQQFFDKFKTDFQSDLINDITERDRSDFQYKNDLLEAERCRTLGKNYEAMELYDRAIQGAIENGSLCEEALANELAASFYIEIGKKKLAKIYITDAYLAYNYCGNSTKVKELKQRYFDLILPTKTDIDDVDNAELKVAPIGIFPTSNSTTNSSRVLDLVAVMKASEAIQSEITSDNLHRTLLHILLESAGAQKGCLILQKDDRLFIEAIDRGEGFAEIVLQSIPVETSKEVPISLIDYVAKNQQPLVLNNLAAEHIYQTD
ncbi:MAG: protein kinase domain-containing protein, partial [Microcoleus sp.]